MHREEGGGVQRAPPRLGEHEVSVDAVPEDLHEYPEIEGHGPETVVFQRRQSRQNDNISEN